MIIKRDFFSPTFLFPALYICVYYFGYFISKRYWKFIGVHYSKNILLFIAIGLFSYLLGNVLALIILNNIKKKVIIRKKKIYEMRILSNKKYTIIYSAFFLLMSSAMVYRLSITGLPYVNFDPENGRYLASLNIKGVISILALSLQILLVYSLIYKYIYTGKKYYINNIYIIINILLLLSTASRNRILIPILTFIVCYHYMKKSINIKKIIIIFILLLMVYVAYGWFRTNLADDLKTGWLEVFEIPPLILPIVSLLMTLMNSTYMLNMIIGKIPTLISFQHGGYLFASILTLLPGKQYGQGVLIKNLLNIENQNPIAISLLGTLWVDFGLIGVIVGMFLIGLILRFLYINMIISRYSLNNTLIYVYVMTYFCQTLYSGLLNSFTDIWFLILLYFISKLIGKKVVKNENIVN